MFHRSPRKMVRGFFALSLALWLTTPSAFSQEAASSQPEEATDAQTAPVTEESVEIPDGSTDDLFDEIDLASQTFSHPDSKMRDREIAVFKIKKLADKIVVRPDASQRQKEIALKYSLTFARKGSEMNPELFRPVYERLLRRVLAEFPTGEQASLAAYMSLLDRINAMGADGNLMPQIKEYQAKYPDAQEAMRVFIDYAERLLTLGRVTETVDVMKSAGQLFSSKDQVKKGFANLEAAYKQQVDLLGRPMDLTGPKLGGGLVNARNSYGNVLLVIFWMSRSPNSQLEMQNVVDVLAKYQSQGVDAIGVSFDGEAEEFSKYLAEHNIKFPQIFFQDASQRAANSPIVKKFSIGRLPTLFAVNREGKIAAVSFRGKETIEQLVQNLLNEKPPAAPKPATEANADSAN